MSKKIKIIDLLNKIANGEEVPKKIIYRNEILEYDEKIQDYTGYSGTGSGSFFNYLFVNKKTYSFINNTVEIIEEQEEIDIQDIKELDFSASPLAKTNLLNELVQAVKQLDKKIKEK